MVKTSCRISFFTRGPQWLFLALAAAVVLLDRTEAQQATGNRAQAQPARTDAATLQPDLLLRLADEVGREVEALRGWSFKQPVTRQIATPLQARQYIERNLETNLPPGAIALVQAGLRTIGLIPPTTDLRATYLSLMENQVAGYYDPDTRTMNLVQRGGPMPPIIERLMLAHELTHALDDQYIDLRALAKPDPTRTEDAELVVASVTEGSATGLMVQYLVKAQLAGRVDVAALTEYAAQEAERSKPFVDAPRYFSSILASYICGMQFLAKGDLMSLATAPDNRAVGRNLLAARADLPRSTEQILHPSKYWDSAQRDEPVLLSDEAIERWLARPGRWIVRKDTVGELLIAILTTPRGKAPSLESMQTAEAWTTPVARGWGGDRFILLASGDSAAEASRSLKDLKGVWITEWDTPADRDEFAASFAGSSVPADAATSPIGVTGLVVFLGFDEAERGTLVKRLADAPLPMTRDGKRWPPPGR